MRLPPPSTPIFWADTPTQAAPRRINSVWLKIQSGAASSPPLTFSHSTHTVPLKAAGSIGRWTSILVANSASSTTFTPLVLTP
jgi:hypothetical protein